MQYDMKIEEVSLIRRKLFFTIDSKEVKKELDQAYARLKTNVRLPGFRKGKVPRWMLEKRFSESITADVSQALVQKGYESADVPLAVVGQPSLEEVGDVEKGADFTFVIGIDVRPEIVVENYQGLDIEFAAPEVSSKDVDEMLDMRLRSKAKIDEADEDASISEGDFALVKIELKEGEEVLVDEPYGTMINTGGDRFYPGVDKLLVGMKKGETKSETITIGEDSILEHLREKEVVASIEVQTIQCYKLPSVEEYAKEEGFEGGAEELRASIEGELSGQYESASKDQSRVQILQKLVQLNTFEVPEGMVNQQLQALMEELSMRRQYAGEDPRKIRFSDDEIKDLRQRASFAAKAACILAAIARQEELAVSDEDLDAKIQELAGSRGQTPEAIRAYLTEENATNILKERILEEKTLNWLFESSNLVAPTPEADEAEPEKGEETGE